jgi:CRP-like cAMP-binding protein
VRERVSRHELARMVGASREMVSRVVLELATQGKLELRDDGGVRLLLPNKELNARPPE